MMQATINGESRELEDGVSLTALVDMLALNLRKVAIEVNLAIVPRSLYAETILKQGDRIEIVQFIGGG